MDAQITNKTHTFIILHAHLDRYIWVLISILTQKVKTNSCWITDSLLGFLKIEFSMSISFDMNQFESNFSFYRSGWLIIKIISATIITSSSTLKSSCTNLYLFWWILKLQQKKKEKFNFSSAWDYLRAEWLVLVLYRLIHG